MQGRPREVEDWLSQLSHAEQEQVLWLAGRVHAAGEDIAEAVRWRRLTFALDGNWHHWLCAVAVTKHGVNLAFHKGSLLEDPAGLLKGEGRYLRQVSHDQVATHPEAVDALLRQAIIHQTDMLD